MTAYLLTCLWTHILTSILKIRHFLLIYGLVGVYRVKINLNMGSNSTQF